MIDRNRSGMRLLLLLAVLPTLVACGACESKGAEERQGYFKETKEDSTLTLQEVQERVQKRAGNTEQVSDSFEHYQRLNEAFGDSEAAWNQGAEALNVFMAHFVKEARYRKARVRLSDPTVVLPPLDDALRIFVISEPDSTGFFSSWSDLSADRASFCNGWLDSEKAQEFFFARDGLQGKWYLVDYVDFSQDVNF